MAASDVCRWGILGAARVNERLMPAILAAKQAELVAVASRRPGAAAEALARYAPSAQGVRCVDDPHALLADGEIDAVYLPMANEEHAAWALLALEAGKHVLIEKPMALNVAEIEAIEREARKRNLMVMEGFMYRFHPQHQAIADWIATGAMGEVRMVRTSFAFPMTPARLYRVNRPIDQGGGALWDIGPYAIHTARLWFDDAPQAAMAMADVNTHGADISVAGQLDFGAGRFAQFEISFAHARRSSYEIIGSLGGVRCEIVWQHAADRPVVHYWTDAGAHGQLDIPAACHFTLEIEAFSAAVLQGQPPAYLTLDDAKANCRTLNAVLESIRTGQRVAIRA